MAQLRTTRDKFKALAILSIIFAVYAVTVFTLLIRLNNWLLAYSLLGITFMGLDLKVYIFSFILTVFGIWLVNEVVNYLQYKRWRNSWK